MPVWINFHENELLEEIYQLATAASLEEIFH